MKKAIFEVPLSNLSARLVKADAPLFRAWSAVYHPSMLLTLPVKGYATGIFSSRKIERATHNSEALRFIFANHHPNHDTLAQIRKTFLAEL